MISTVLWNVEGVLYVLENGGSELFQKFDVCLLTETFALKEIDINGFYLFNGLAQKRELGRPFGGVSIAVKPHLNPKLLFKNMNTVAVETETCIFACCYLSPVLEVEDVIDTIASALNCYSGPKPMIFAGDLNARVDYSHPRTSHVETVFSDYNFCLCNNPEDITYITDNGQSTIDLFWTNLPAKNYKVETIRNSSASLLRKHIPVSGFFTVSSPQQHSSVKQFQLQRKVDVDILESVNLRPVELAIENTNQDLAFNLMNELILSVAPVKEVKEKVEVQNKDIELKRLKRTATRLLKKTKRNPSNRLEYLQAKKCYRLALKQKKDETAELEEIKLIQTAEELPWKLNPKKNGSQSCPVPIEAWNVHFGQLLNSTSRCNKTETLNLGPELADDHLCNRPFSEMELETCMLSTKDKKATGPDNISNELLKGSFYFLGHLWLMLFNLIWTSCKIVSCWRTSFVKVLYKGKGTISDPNNYRGIALCSHVMKIFTKLVAWRLTSVIKQTIPNEQYGFVAGRSTFQAFNCLRNAVKETLACKGTPLYAAFIDFRKAFDTVPRKKMINKLLDYHNVGGQLLKVINDLLEPNKILVNDGLRLSEPINQTCGVLQGDSLSPILFISFVADLPDKLKACGVEVVMYADDLLFFSSSQRYLQDGLDVLNQWIKENGMEVNIDKTKIVKFRRGGKLKNTDRFYFGNDIVEIVNEYEYLGFLVTSYWSFSAHITKKKTKCQIASYAVKKLSGLSLKNALKYFDIMIKPIVEYGVHCFWEDLTASQMMELDKVKTTFLKRVLCLPMCTLNRMVIVMCNCPTLCENLVAKGLPRIEEYLKYIELLEYKYSNIDLDFYNSPALCQEDWKRSLNKNRHLVCRASTHGFHHKICDFRLQKGHSRCENCICRLCGDSCSHLLHVLSCPAIPDLSMVDSL